MALNTIRFGVRNEADHRAATWTFAFKPSADGPDCYLFCRAIGKYLKTSFHRRKWRHAWVRDKFGPLFEGIENAPEDRCFDEWDPPSPPPSGLTLALRIYTPWSAPRVRIDAGESNIIWVPSAPKPRWTEMRIYFIEPRHGRLIFDPDTKPNGVIAHEALGDGRSVGIVYATIDPPTILTPAKGYLGLFAKRTAHDLRRAKAGLWFGGDDQGRTLVDAPLQLTEDAIRRISAREGETREGI
jgi:hypothetical protein